MNRGRERDADFGLLEEVLDSTRRFAQKLLKENDMLCARLAQITSEKLVLEEWLLVLQKDDQRQLEFPVFGRSENRPNS